ncbi:MAG: translation initiation factor [Chitinophagaceae bacterium]|nr:translation initiation factor [Chitinophagaceae bacterium]
MSKKNKPDARGFVFSTDPNFSYEEEHQETQETPEPASQRLKVSLDKKQRAGKVVTLVSGFKGSIPDLDDLGKKLKNFCGTGGSVKDREIVIQGDQRQKALQWLIKNGFTNSKM